MTERRTLIEGLKPALDLDLEKQFVYGGVPKAAAKPEPAALEPPSARLTRSPLTTKIRSDYAAALKRASLTRQLEGVTPNLLQEILEEALGPWLEEHGYLKS